jgi:hypothetical protein
VHDLDDYFLLILKYIVYILNIYISNDHPKI